MVLKWDAFWVAPPCRRSDYSPLLLPQALETSADTLPSTAFRGSIAGCFSVLTEMLKCKLHLSLADTLRSGFTRAAEQSFLARKVSLNQVRGHVRSRQPRDYSPCLAQPRPAALEPVLCTKHRKELYSYRFVS